MVLMPLAWTSANLGLSRDLYCNGGGCSIDGHGMHLVHVNPYGKLPGHLCVLRTHVNG